MMIIRPILRVTFQWQRQSLSFIKAACIKEEMPLHSLEILPNLCGGKRELSLHSINAAELPPRSDRTIGLKQVEQIKMMKAKPQSPPGSRIAKVAIIGAPNAGKSTIANKLLGWRFAVVSEKVHTTRAKTLGILTEGTTQIIFLDTPGMIKSPVMKRHALERSLLTDPHSSICEADLIMVVVDVSTPWGIARLDEEVLKALHLHKDKKSVLILNKIDKMKVKRHLLVATRKLTNGLVGGRRDSFTPKEVQNDPTMESLQSQQSSDSSGSKDIRENETEKFRLARPGNKGQSDAIDWDQYTKALRKIERKIKSEAIEGWSHFDRVFMLIAKNGDGIWDLKNYLIDHAEPGEWMYDENLITTQMPLDMAKQCIWEKCMDNLVKDIPYKIEVKNNLWEYDENGSLRAEFTIVCNRTRQMRNVIGKDGVTIRKIASEAKQALLDTFRQDMTLRLSAKLKN